MRNFYVIMGLLFSLGSISVQANTTCSGPLEKLVIDPYNNGTIGFHYITPWTEWYCSVVTTKDTVRADACKAVYSTLMAAQLASKSIEVKYTSDIDCNDHNARSDSTIYAISIID